MPERESGSPDGTTIEEARGIAAMITNNLIVVALQEAMPSDEKSGIAAPPRKDPWLEAAWLE